MWTQSGVGALWTNCPHLQAMCAGPYRFLHLVDNSWPPEAFCHKDSIWSCPWWPASQWHPFRMVTWCALGTQRGAGLQFYLRVLKIGPRLPDESWNSVDSIRSVYLLCWRHGLWEASSGLSASVSSVSPTQHSTLVPFSGLWPSW